MDDAGLDCSYDKMYEAYDRIFKRCGLVCRAVEADTGAIGGSNSHEFTAISEVGESEIAYCAKCLMAATVERAECVDAPPQDDVKMLPVEEVNTPGAKTIDEVADFLRLDKKQTIKALLFTEYDENGAESRYIAAFVRGDRELNVTKLVNALGIAEHQLEFADEESMGEATGAVGGFTGPIGLHDCAIVVDSELTGLKNLCAGACKEDFHLLNVNYGRDYKADIVTDLKVLEEGDSCPVCGAPVFHARGIEVGQVFKLGTKYSQMMGAYFDDERQEQKPIVMGCYGIGVTRTLAAVVEQHHDENGIVWPVAIAPYHVIITLIKPEDPKQKELAEKIYDELNSKDVETLLDDRQERPGVKFKDADLIGIPLRITVGKLASEGRVEYKLRREAEKKEVTAQEAIDNAVMLVRNESTGRLGR